MAADGAAAEGAADDVYQLIDGEIYNSALVAKAKALGAKTGGALSVDGAKELWMGSIMFTGESEGMLFLAELRTMEYIVKTQAMDPIAKELLKSVLKDAKLEAKSLAKEAGTPTPKKSNMSPSGGTPLQEVERIQDQLANATSPKEVDRLQRSLQQMLEADSKAEKAREAKLAAKEKAKAKKLEAKERARQKKLAAQEKRKAQKEAAREKKERIRAKKEEARQRKLDAKEKAKARKEAAKEKARAKKLGLKRPAAAQPELPALKKPASALLALPAALPEAPATLKKPASAAVAPPAAPPEAPATLKKPASAASAPPAAPPEAPAAASARKRPAAAERSAPAVRVYSLRERRNR